jgi:hypothetical protein
MKLQVVDAFMEGNQKEVDYLIHKVSVIFWGGEIMDGHYMLKILLASFNTELHDSNKKWML